ncbi:MAG: hypothetical protein U1E26_01895 [Coriobacteriia bacterium]|nr:hypothetical protein [Coriobacteriia bacterium]
MNSKRKAALVAAVIVAALFAMQLVAWAVSLPVPTVTHVTTPIDAEGGWVRSATVTVSITAVEASPSEPIKSINYTVNGVPGVVATTTSPATIDLAVAADGTTTITYSATNSLDQTSTPKTVLIQKDLSAPVTTWTANPAIPASGYTSVTVVPSIVATDNNMSGVKSITYRVGGAGATTTVDNTTSVTLSAVPTEGATLLEFYSTDATLNVETTKSATIRIDKTKPTAAIDATASYSAAAVTTITASDPTSAGVSSGISYIQYRIDNGATQTVMSAVATTTPVSQLGTHTVIAWAVDKAGNVSTQTSRTFVVKDMTPPVSTVATLPTGWVSTDVTVSITATDNVGGSGLAGIRYTLNSGFETTYTAPFLATMDGTNTIVYRAVDASGNLEAARTAYVLIDKSAPTGPSALNYSSLTDTGIKLVWPAAIDTRSGVAFYEVYDGATRVATTTALSSTLTSITPGSTRTFSVAAVDRVGNVSTGAVRAVTFPAAGATAPVAPGASVTTTIGVPAGGLSGAGEASVTIVGVTGAGTLKLVRLAQEPAAAPAGFVFLGENYDLSFTGTFTGLITVRMPYDPRIPAARAAALGVRHWNGSVWETVPVAVDAVNHTLTFQLSSLSPLSVVEPGTTNTLAKLAVPSAYYPVFARSSNVTVRLNDAASVGLDGFEVVLQRYAGGVWSDYAAMAPVAGVPGAYRVLAAPVGGVRTLFRVKMLANGLYTAVEAPFAVVPQAKLSTPRASTARPRPYRTFYLSGNVLPKGTAYGRIQVQRLVRGRWVTSSVSFTANSSGSYRKAVKLRAGTYRFRAQYGSNKSSSRNALSYSSYTKRIVVK